MAKRYLLGVQKLKKYNKSRHHQCTDITYLLSCKLKGFVLWLKVRGKMLDILNAMRIYSCFKYSQDFCWSYSLVEAFEN